MHAADDLSGGPERDDDGKSGAVVYVRCRSCGQPVRLAPPGSDEPARCDGCGTLAGPSATDA